MGYDGPNYTQTPNAFLDEHLPDMGHAECKVVLAVIRQTFGWHKRKDRLSISQLMDLTGLSNRGVIDGIQSAMGRGVLDRTECGDSYEYWLVVDGENTSQGGVSEAHRGGEDTSQGGVSNPHTQKKGKETNQKRERAPARGDAVGDLFDELIDVVRDERVLTRTWEDQLKRIAKQVSDTYEPETVAEALRKDLRQSGRKWSADTFVDNVLPSHVNGSDAQSEPNDLRNFEPTWHG